MEEQKPAPNGWKGFFKLLGICALIGLVWSGCRAVVGWATEDLTPSPSPVSSETTSSDKAEPIPAETLGKIMLIAEDVTYSKYEENPDHFSDIFVQVTGKVKLALENEETGAELIFLTEISNPENLWFISYLPEVDAGYYYDKGETITAYGNHLEEGRTPDTNEPILSFFAYHIERIALPDDAEVTP